MSIKSGNNEKFIPAVALAYFEILSITNHTFLIKQTRKNLESRKFHGSPLIRKAVNLFLDFPNLQTLNIIQHDFDLFVNYLITLSKSSIQKLAPDLIFNQHTSYTELHSSNLIQPICNKLGLALNIFHPNTQSLESYSPKNSVSATISLNLQFGQPFTQIHESPPIILDLIYKTRVIEYKNCEFCFKECKNKLSCGHYSHKKCTKDAKCPSCSIQIKLKCKECFRESLFLNLCPNSCHICKNCLILRSLSGQITCFCSKTIEINPVLFICESCKSSKAWQEFLPFICPDAHDFLCKACWKFAYLEHKNSEKALRCPYTQHELSAFSQSIKNLLKIRCVQCKKKKLQYLGPGLCPNKCKVCFSCQSWASNNSANIQSCVFCYSKLTKSI